MEDLKQWIADNHLNVEFINDRILKVNGFEGTFLVLSNDKDNMFHHTDAEKFIPIFDDIECELAGDHQVTHIIYKFGSFWFYRHIDDAGLKLNFFRYIGTPDSEIFPVPFLGVHGKYELCNGSRDYNDWVKKAKFLKYTALGICESQTLAGVYNFQKACDKEQMKAIVGRTSKIKPSVGAYYFIKSFVMNAAGWKSILKIHNIEIVDRATDGKYITEEELSQHSDGLIHIICHETDLDLVDFEKYDLSKTFFQFNTVQYKFNNKEKEHLFNLKKYLDKYIKIVHPVVIQDSYYLDKGDHVIKPFLNKVINNISQFSSSDEYLKPYQDVIVQSLSLFNSDDPRVDQILDQSFENLQFIQDSCNYQVKREGMHLPKYQMNEDEKLLYKNNEDMFFSLIEKGFNEKIKGKVEDEQVYIDRIEKEVEVLQEGNVLDYFLILYDIVNFSLNNGSIGNLGRGSAAGSLISYLFGIVRIDPIKYNLLFERFLNRARLLGGSLPDIDFDCPSFFRSVIIEYLNNKYGNKNVACIGTAQNFKLKSTLKDLLKAKGVDFSSANFITSLIDKDHDKSSIEGLFEIALKEPKLKEILNKYPEIVYEIYLCIFQPRSYGIHAAGVVIFPSEDKDGNPTQASDYVPLRFSGEQRVTEWEKDAVEEVGLLKLDLLGLLQLDKIIKFNQLITENGKTYTEFEDLDFEDQKVFKLFQNAVTEDIFQFNTDVQKNYLLQLFPSNVKDLVAANALNRPGAMETNSHNEYIKIKDGKIPENLPFLLEDILRETRGLFVFQEQAMLAYQVLTECDLNEADNFRKVVSKSKPGKIDPNIQQYEKNFKEAYVAKGAEQKLADDIWSKIIGFTSYSFNKSHAVSYALTGYWAAYYKAYFPVEFYTSSLEEAGEDGLKRLINEIQSQELTTLSHPNINKSGTQYSIDVVNNAIYWSLSSVKFAGEKAIGTLLEEREKNGKYFSFEEFLDRAKDMKVNKRVITNFILAGAFDEIEKIHEAKDRMRLLKFYYDKIKEDIPEDIRMNKDVNKNFFWILLQKQTCGLGNINFEGMFRSQKATHWPGYSFMDAILLKDESSVDKIAVVAGLLENVIVRQTKKGGEMCQLMLNSNGESIYVTLWQDEYLKYKEVINSSMFQPLFVSGKVQKDSYKRQNVIISDRNATKLMQY